jgi:hypothetical protein
VEDRRLRFGPGYGLAQAAVAPNAIELHPILRFDCLSG